MRKSGFPVQKNPAILNQPNSTLTDFNQPPADGQIINLGEQFRDSIVFRAEESLDGAVIGQFVFPGQQLKIILQGLGLPRKDSWGIVLQVFETMVKVFRQDGSTDLFSRLDPKVQQGVFPYAVGNPVWFDVFSNSPRTGFIQDITRKAGSEEIETFTIQADDTGEILTVPITNAVIKLALPGFKPQFQSNYNAVSVDNLPKPGLVLPEQKP